MSENSPDDVDQTDGSATFLRQVFELWLNPEIERRKSAGAQCVPFALHRAQVIMNVGAPNVVRLNDEVRAGFFAKPRDDLSTLKVGDPIDWDAIETIEEVRLTDHDADAAHVTLLLVGGRWLLTFDFRYNSSRARKLCDAAEQFFEAAVNARAKNHDRAFMENLFAATELAAQAFLTMEPDERIVTARNHKFIAAKMNLHSRFGNVDPALVHLLNELTRKRGDARYVGGHVDVTPQRMDEMLGIVRSNIDLLSTTMPKRFPSSLESKS